MIHQGILRYRGGRYLWWAIALVLGSALLYATQRFPFPLEVSLRYVDRVAGTNNRTQSRFLGLVIDAYF